MPRVTLYPEQLEALARERNAGLAAPDAGPPRPGDLPPSLEEHHAARDEADFHRTRELELEAAHQLRQLAEGVRRQRGFASASALEEARRAADQLRLDLMRDAPTRAAREVLGPNFDHRMQIFDHDLSNHVEKEKLGARLDLSRQRQALAEQDAINAQTPLAFDTHAQTAANEIAEQARLTGQSAARAEAAKALMLTGLQQARIEELQAQKAWDGAMIRREPDLASVGTVGAVGASSRIPDPSTESDPRFSVVAFEGDVPAWPMENGGKTDWKTVEATFDRTSGVASSVQENGRTLESVRAGDDTQSTLISNLNAGERAQLEAVKLSPERVAGIEAALVRQTTARQPSPSLAISEGNRKALLRLFITDTTAFKAASKWDSRLVNAFIDSEPEVVSVRTQVTAALRSHLSDDGTTIEGLRLDQRGYRIAVNLDVWLNLSGDPNGVRANDVPKLGVDAQPKKGELVPDFSASPALRGFMYEIASMTNGARINKGQGFEKVVRVERVDGRYYITALRVGGTNGSHIMSLQTANTVAFLHIHWGSGLPGEVVPQPNNADNSSLRHKIAAFVYGSAAGRLFEVYSQKGKFFFGTVSANGTLSDKHPYLVTPDQSLYKN